MKKSILTAILFAMTLTLTACGGGGGSPATNAGGGEPPVVDVGGVKKPAGISFPVSTVLPNPVAVGDDVNISFTVDVISNFNNYFVDGYIANSTTTDINAALPLFKYTGSNTVLSSIQTFKRQSATTLYIGGNPVNIASLDLTKPVDIILVGSISDFLAPKTTKRITINFLP